MDEHEDAISLDIDEELAPAPKGHWFRRPRFSRQWFRQHWVSLLTVAAIVILSVVIYFTGGLTGDVEAYGYLGVFIIAILGAAVIIVPVPHLPFIFIMGAILNPWLVGLIAGLGEPIGEIPAYMAGYSGRNTMQNRKVYIRLREWMQRRGTIVLFLFSAIPNFFFDIVGAAAGALHYPFWKYMVVVFAGKTVKGLLVAFAGYWTLRLLLDLLIPW